MLAEDDMWGGYSSNIVMRTKGSWIKKFAIIPFKYENKMIWGTYYWRIHYNPGSIGSTKEITTNFLDLLKD